MPIGGLAGSEAGVRQEFADLVFADEEWLDAEFAAIIAANWRGRGVAVPGPRRRHGPGRSVLGRWAVAEVPMVGGGGRERSPP